MLLLYTKILGISAIVGLQLTFSVPVWPQFDLTRLPRTPTRETAFPLEAWAKQNKATTTEHHTIQCRSSDATLFATWTNSICTGHLPVMAESWSFAVKGGKQWFFMRSLLLFETAKDFVATLVSALVILTQDGLTILTRPAHEGKRQTIVINY